MRGSWDLCPADLRSGLAGIAQLLLSWNMGNGLGSLEEVSGFVSVWNETVVNKVLGFPEKVVQWGHLWAGWAFTGLPWGWSKNAPKPSCLPGSVQLTGVGVLGIARWKQSVFLCLRVPLMGLRAVGSLGELSRWGSAIGVWSVLVLKTMNFYCGQNFCHVNAQIPCLLVLTPQCVLQLQRLCWIINILL